MPVRNIRSIRPRVWIPTTYRTYYKIVITGDDDVDYTVADTYGGAVANNYTLKANITRTLTEQLGTFNLTLVNDDGRFLNKFDGGEVIHVYGDSTNATTLLMRGKIDNVKYNLSLSGYTIEINGRDYPEMADRIITGIEAAVKSDVSVAGILNEYFSNVTLLFWNGTEWIEATYNETGDTVSWSGDDSSYPSTLINMTYQDKKGWGVIKEIYKRAGMEAYMEYDVTNSRWTLRTFIKDAITNDQAGVSYGINLLGLSDYGKDNNDIFNRVKVYGKQESDNIILLHTSEDTDSQDNFWIKDSVIHASDLQTMEEVEDKADFERDQGILTDSDGRINSVGLATIKPGQLVPITVPYTPANGYHRVTRFSHNFGNSFTTMLELSKKTKTLKDLFVGKVNPDDFTSPSINVNDMRDSYTVFFDENPAIMTYASTEQLSGRLRLSGTETSGYAVSTTINTDFDVSKCELRRYNSYNAVSDTYQVSIDGGVNWENYSTSASNVHTFDVTGRKLKFKVNINRSAGTDPSPEYESISLLYK